MKNLKRILCCLLVVTGVLYTTGFAVAQNEPSQQRLTSSFGPNEIEPVLFQFSSDPAEIDRGGNIALKYWPVNCKSCYMTAMITRKTNIFDTNGKKLKLEIFNSDSVFEAQYLFFKSGSTSIISSMEIVIND